MKVTGSSSYSIKVYPYRGFSVTRQREVSRLVPEVYSQVSAVESTVLVPRGEGLSGYKLGFPTEYKYPSDLGLSDVANSHRKRKRRGLNGFTSANKHRVKSAAFLLEKEYRRDCLSFLTLTLPQRFVNSSADRLAELIRQFVQSLTRHLQAEGIWSGIVGVAEIQEKRFERTGDCAVHWHLVFCGRKLGNSWAVSADKLRELWRRSLSAVYRRDVPADEVLAAVDIQRVKKSAYRYLGKYLSKGSGIIESVIERLGCDVIPFSWAVCSHCLKKKVDASIIKRSGNDIAFLLDSLSGFPEGLLIYSKHLYLDFPDGGRCWIAFYGELSEAGLDFVLKHL